MNDTMQTYLRLGRAAMLDPSLVPNHLEHGIPIKLMQKVEKCLEILDIIEDDPTFEHRLNNECLEALPILEFYMETI